MKLQTTQKSLQTTGEAFLKLDKSQVNNFRFAMAACGIEKLLGNCNSEKGQ